ncbi:MAG: heavy metal translocating P-type ATPase [Betaproteobacteria bacterium]|nr:heavy metal translocating P-type ATPase [Betaproteobacteria bacterium]
MADPHSIDEAGCYHCGLPLPPGGTVTSQLAGEERAFCCVGCEAVAHAIVGQGLQEYYRFREALPPRGDAAAGTAERFRVYDDPAAQASFVTTGDGNEREAALILEGVRCAACVWVSEQSIRRVPGVLSAQVNYATHRARVRWDTRRVRLSEILGAVAAVGYQAHPYDARHLDAVQAEERRSALWRLLIAGLGMTQVMMYAIPAYIADAATLPEDIGQLLRWASFCLTVPVVVYSAHPFFQGAWRDLRRARLGMDVPVVLGIGVAFIASVWATLRGGGEVYFDSVTMFIFLLLLGRFLELGARQRAVGALAHLGKLVPEYCARIAGYPASRHAETVPVGALRRGDVMLVKPGEAIAADGIVLEGESVVDESLMTGETRPVRKAPDSAVMGGSVNRSGALAVRVQRVGADSVLGTIARLAERATSEKPRVVELADRAAHWFVLAVLALALATGAWWLANDPERALWVTVSVLIVTCPCALSLATPVALTAATGALARRGFVATRGHTIEALARATDFVFDKTGTLTQGALQVERVEIHGGMGIARCLAIAGALERASEHPYGAAIRAHAARAGVQDEQQVALPRNEPGAGIEGRVEGVRYRIGSEPFCTEIAGALAPPGVPGRASIVHLAREGEWLASFVLRDALKPEAGALVGALKRAGKSAHLLSGDSAEAAADIARTLGITNVRAEATPEDKREYVKALQASGHVVAMIGDGVNDAPVIAQADVSVAMASGARLAQVKADAVLLSGDAGDLTWAIAQARKARRIIGQNIAWAVAYNAIAVPAAMVGWITPWMAGIGMAASSLLVVLNAGRLVGRTNVTSDRKIAVRELKTA